MRRKLMGIAVFLMLSLLLPLTLRASEIPLGTSGGIYTVPVQVNGSVMMQFRSIPAPGSSSYRGRCCAPWSRTGLSRKTT